MIKIGNLKYIAEQEIVVYQNNIVYSQPCELGFDVQDGIKKTPIVVEITVIIFDEPTTLHGQWDCFRINNRTECVERMAPSDPNTGTYEHLLSIRDNRELVTLDCSEHAKIDPFIFPNMAITDIKKEVMKGTGVFVCTVLFTQVTKTDILTEDLYIQEATLGDDGVMVQSVLWSKEPPEPTNTESLSEVPDTENVPNCHALSPNAQNVTSKNMLEDLWDWGSGIIGGMRGSLAFLVEP